MYTYTLLTAIFLTLVSTTLHSETAPTPLLEDTYALPDVPSPIMDDVKIMRSASLVDVEGEPSAIIHGCVNAISGGYCETPVDLVQYHGVDPFPVSRSWMGSANTGSDVHCGWYLNLGGSAWHGKGKRESDKEKLYIITASQEQGSILHYSMPSSGDKYTSSFRVDKLVLEKGVTNTSQGFSSGQTNLRNRKFVMEDKKNLYEYLGNGEKRTYTPDSAKTDGYLRTCDLLPSGNSITYGYDKYGKEKVIDSVHLYNSKGECWGGHYDDPAKQSKKRRKIHFLFG